mmetsp:Transcript_15145/g.35104  ORF Transcript_15145/g.35104 Transcript_15145/m.35104 type:complete len:312 (+) Transcript_15145:507-1442(+)
MESTIQRDGSSHENDHVLISPPSGAERLFLGVYEASDLSAKMLTEKLHQTKNLYRRPQKENNRSARIRKSGSFHTAQTRPGSVTSADDFVTCAENSFDIDSIASNENSLNSPVTGRFHECIESTHPNSINSGSNNMTSVIEKITENVDAVNENRRTSMKPLPDVEPVAPNSANIDSSHSANDEKFSKVDAAEIMYDKAKDILNWGKSVPVVSLLVGTSEVVAGKALGIVGSDLSELDEKIESELLKFDIGFLNPAIEAFAKIVIDVAGKSEASMKPIIEILLKPLGLLIKSEDNESSPNAHTENPEVTIAK